MLFKETVTPALLRIASLLCSIPELAHFRMVGGTAIALQLGHRKSVDIDFFTNEKIDRKILQKVLRAHFKQTEFFISTDNIMAEIEGVRVELYDDWLIPFRTEPVTLERLRLASTADLAAFKLSAITGRREKKDYVDLYFLFEHLGLESVLTKFKEYDPLLSPKSLLFALSEVKTAQANQSVMPDMLKEHSWPAITEVMLKASRTYLNIIKQNQD